MESECVCDKINDSMNMQMLKEIPNGYFKQSTQGSFSEITTQSVIAVCGAGFMVRH